MTLCAGGGRSRDIFLELAVRQIVREELAAVEARRAAIASERSPATRSEPTSIVEGQFADAKGAERPGAPTGVGMREAFDRAIQELASEEAAGSTGAGRFEDLHRQAFPNDPVYRRVEEST